MTTILVLHDDRSVDEFEYEADVRSVTIGRRPSNDVCIQDRSVSGRHARLTVRDDGTWLEDLGSTNGTWLDGDAVIEHRLEDGDEVLVGKVRLKIHTLDVWGQSPAPAEADGREAIEDDEADEARVAAPRAAPASREPLDEEEAFVEQSLAASDDDDELDESMRRALELYGEDEDDEPAPPPRAPRDEDEPDFAEDARLFAQSASADDPDEREQHERERGRSRAPEELALADADDDLSLSDRAKAALGRGPAARPRLHAVGGSSGGASTRPEARESRRVPAPAGADDFDDDPYDARGDALERSASATSPAAPRRPAEPGRPAAVPKRSVPMRKHADDDDDGSRRIDAREPARRPRRDDDRIEPPTHELDRPSARSRGAVIQIKNGAKSGQILPIDKPVTTLGRPGIQIAAIMRKPDGYFLMHIESDDAVDRPTLNSDSIGDEPVLLHSGDELNVAGIDVEFMLS